MLPLRKPGTVQVSSREGYYAFLGTDLHSRSYADFFARI